MSGGDLFGIEPGAGGALSGTPRIWDGFHGAVWEGKDAAGATSFAELRGGAALALTGSHWAAGRLGLYQRQSRTAWETDYGAANDDCATAALTVPALKSVVVETSFVLDPGCQATANSALALFDLTDGTHYIFGSLTNSSSDGHGVYVGLNATGTERNTATGGTGNYLVPFAQVPRGVPLHVAVAVDVAAGTVTLYLAGKEVVHITDGTNVVALPTGAYTFSLLLSGNNNVPFLGKLGDIAVSFITGSLATLRGPAYFRAAQASLQGS